MSSDTIDAYAYACILQGDNLLVETENASEALNKVITLIAENVNMDSRPQKGCFGTYQTLRYCYLVGEGFCFVIGADERVQMRINMSFLEHVRRDFFDKFVHGGQKLHRGKYRKYLRAELEFFMTNKEADKLRGVLMEVEEVKEIMAENLKKAVERGEKLERLQEQTQQLEENAQEFHREARKLKCRKCRQYYCCCFASCCVCCDACC
mmetsp:Transcript_1956/g.5413  ORF Transcript_1956/g.5413 Transcript_1956/m.5413 type:complete len:208 (+) Transcript_1956:162-785(+)